MQGYGGGTSEKRLGRSASAVFAGHPELEPLYMTKFLPAPWRGLTHACFERALRASLRRLGASRCPIYLLHSPVHWRPIEFWVEAAAKCKKKGLLTALGLSNCNADQVRRAVSAGKKYGVEVVVNQVMFNLLDYNSPSLREMKRTCDELHVTIIAYSPFGQGLLADNLTEEAFEVNKPAKMMRLKYDSLSSLRRVIKRIADDHGNKSMAQVTINWCRAHGTIPLVGCRTVRQARDSLGALEWDLSKEEVKELDQLALSRSTLDSPKWRRGLFVGLASIVMTMCRIFDMFGFGMVLEASR